MIGLFSYVIALPLCFLGLAWVARQVRAPSARRQLALALLAVAVFYLHLSALILLAGGALVVTLCLSREAPGTALRRLLWLAPVAALGCAWALRSPCVYLGRRRVRRAARGHVSHADRGAARLAERTHGACGAAPPIT